MKSMLPYKSLNYSLQFWSSALSLVSSFSVVCLLFCFPFFSVYISLFSSLLSPSLLSPLDFLLWSLSPLVSFSVFVVSHSWSFLLSFLYNVVRISLETSCQK